MFITINKKEKIFLRDLEKEKIIKLIENNRKLMNIIRNDYHDEQMEAQSDDSEIIMGKNWYKYVEYRNNYNSFYLKLKNWEQFYENLDADYLSNEARKIYDNLKNKIDKLNEIEYAEEGYFELEDEIESNCKELLQDIEKYLHGYEGLPDDDEIIRYYIDNIMEIDKDYYILVDENGNDDGIIRLDITYTEDFN